eukprot:gnl/Spiro4/21815_TR10699_c0_g1_i1.p1 gnl/Spiro4/21815_TR10699_c0_g1~~gnl/Spiro4/21815_TR10699_c0_g1_i1.p1  ORF type:complete len:372 (+),score=153.75 gnl/Spiro4/21815_TR10699_c0_g1_i1:137-1117(+)
MELDSDNHNQNNNNSNSNNDFHHHHLSPPVSDDGSTSPTDPPQHVSQQSAFESLSVSSESAEYEVVSTSAAAEMPSRESSVGGGGVAPPVDRRIGVFHRREESISQAAGREEDDDFFKPTEADIRYIHATQQRRAEFNKALMSQSQRDKLMRGPERAYATAVLRFTFPSGHIVQANFAPHETLETLYDFVRGALKESLAYCSFYLYVTPPVRRLVEMTHNLKTLKLVPAAVVYVGFDDKSIPATEQVLMPELLDRSVVLDATTPAHTIVPRHIPSGDESRWAGVPEPMNVVEETQPVNQSTVRHGTRPPTTVTPGLSRLLKGIGRR